MKKYCGTIAELHKKVIEGLSLRVHAEEESSGGNEPTVNYEDLIAKARKEEKDKQFKTIERYKTQVGSLTEQHNGDLIRIAELEKQLGDANNKLTSTNNGDSDAVKTLKEELDKVKKVNEDLNEKVKNFEDNKPPTREEVEADVRKVLEAEYEVKTYKATKLAEMKDSILVPELVGGDTKEDIDKSIQAALERSNEIKKSLGISDKPKRTPKSTSNPSVNSVQDNEISLEYLASLDVSSEEYAKVRKQLGLR